MFLHNIRIHYKEEPPPPQKKKNPTDSHLVFKYLKIRAYKVLYWKNQ